MRNIIQEVLLFGAALLVASGCAAGEQLESDPVATEDSAPRVEALRSQATGQPMSDEPSAAPASAADAGGENDVAPPPVVESSDGGAGPAEAEDAMATPAWPADSDGGALARPDSLDGCPGEALPLGLAHTTVSISASTTALADNASSSKCPVAKGGHDAVYRFTAPGAGKATVTLTPNGYSGTVYVREGACESGTELACSSAPILNLPSSVVVPVSAGSVYYVFADQAYGFTQGSFVLTVAFQGS